MKMETCNPQWRNAFRCRTTGHMHDKWPRFTMRHAGTGRKITEIPQQGLTKGVCMSVCQSASGEWQRRHAASVTIISGMLTLVKYEQAWTDAFADEEQMDLTDTQSVKKDVMMPHVDGHRLWRALVERRRDRWENRWMINEWMSKGENDAWICWKGWMEGIIIHVLEAAVKDGGGCWQETLDGHVWVLWGVLPVCEGGGDPGWRGWWRGGPPSSSPPPAPESAVQTAPPAPWPTPAEPLRSHTAPYTLHHPKGREWGVTHLHAASDALQHKERVSNKNTTLQTK